MNLLQSCLGKSTTSAKSRLSSLRSSKHPDSSVAAPEALNTEPVDLSRRSSAFQLEQSSRMTLKEEINDALRAYVFNSMPIRLLQLPEKKLLEKGAIFKHLLPKVSDITEGWVTKKVNTTRWEEVEFVSTPQERRQRVLEDAIKERAQYAILSHTWLLDEPEVTYDNWQKGENMDGPGFAKLDNFAKVAYRNHGLTLAWLDTLCINKDSTSELDESIRSMYRWYLNSAICIVILADTVAMADVPKDRWFTRGWTLQELLAPRCLKFYSKNWKPLVPGDNDKERVKSDDDDDDEDNRNKAGKKSGLSIFAPLIQKATGITLSELQDFNPTTTRRDIPTRMVWASKRVTTREEDRAYCLMGIFGVSFSIAYGEGRERAFFRLLEAILGTYRDILAILDWAGKPIGRDVHATSLLPSGPECYKHRPGEPRLESGAWRDIQDYVPFSFAPKEPMTLTHLGLRIDLFCIPAKVKSRKEYNGTYTVGMKCGAKFSEKIFLVNVYPHNYLHFDEDEDEGYGNEFMFGVWTFERDSEDTVYLPNEPCRAFLLESTDPAQPIEMPRVWKKVDTPETLRIKPDSPWDTDWDMDEISMRTFIL